MQLPVEQSHTGAPSEARPISQAPTHEDVVNNVAGKEAKCSPPKVTGMPVGSKNVLYAVMALLPELDSEELSLVAQEVQQLLSITKR